MCGNDISTIPIPGQDFINIVEPQLGKGVIKICILFIYSKQINKLVFHKSTLFEISTLLES
jgi:hypothetical protein